ncbi:MAG: hypothetical protein ACOX2Q_02980 [Dehalobacterium sp.]
MAGNISADVGGFNIWVPGWVFQSLAGLVCPQEGGSKQFPCIAKNNKILGRYLIRLFVDFLAMATYLIHRDVYVLVGTALGLTLFGKVLSMKYSLVKKEVK